MGDREIVNAREKFYEEPGKRHLNLVFQSYAPWPHMTVFDNVAFGLEVAKVPKEEIRRKVENALKRMRIEAFIDRYPSELSGGQQQRLCIARALAVEPEILLMDEPTSALDPISTLKIEDLMGELKKNYTVVIVTHNMQQATRISDKTAFFLHGEIVEFDETQRIFSNPKEQKTLEYITGRFG